MAITKTNFINYTRCSRYVSLDKEAKEKGRSKTSYDEYKNEEELENAKELLGDLVENTENNLNNKQTEAMLPFYKMVEIEAGKITKKYFPGLLSGPGHPVEIDIIFSSINFPPVFHLFSGDFFSYIVNMQNN